jgi:P-type Cu2+ transporter
MRVDKKINNQKSQEVHPGHQHIVNNYKLQIDHNQQTEHMHGINSKNAKKSIHIGHQTKMVSDFKKRFIVSTILTIPVLLLSPIIQNFLRLENILNFTGDSYVLFALSSAVFFYGGWPFLKGIFSELKSKQPGMMTLIALAIVVAYVYSSAVIFGLSGMVFFWELVTLIDVMLLGHWIEMKSVAGASRALMVKLKTLL